MIRILSFIIFIIGIIFITIGFAHQNSPTYTSKKKFVFVPTGKGTGYHQLLFALGMPHEEIGYPSTSFLRSDLSVIDNASGYLSAKELLAAIGKIVQ